MSKIKLGEYQTTTEDLAKGLNQERFDVYYNDFSDSEQKAYVFSNNDKVYTTIITDKILENQECTCSYNAEFICTGMKISDNIFFEQEGVLYKFEINNSTIVRVEDVEIEVEIDLDSV